MLSNSFNRVEEDTMGWNMPNLFLEIALTLMGFKQSEKVPIVGQILKMLEKESAI